MASASGSAGKTCRRCGVDCSKLPRVKDDRGRYYCKPCYEAARREKVRRDAARAALAAEPEPAAVDDEPVDVEPIDTAEEDSRTTEIALEADSFAIGDWSEAPLQLETVEETCPGCGGAMAASAVVCLGCGFNRKTGRRMAMSEAGGAVAAPPTERLPIPRVSTRGDAGTSAVAASGFAAQPWFFGLASAVFFVALYALATRSLAIASVYQGLQMLFSLVIGLWILVVAFQEGAIHGILCLLCGPYALYYGLVRQDNRHLKFGMGASLMAFVLSLVLGGNMLLEALAKRAGT